MADYDRDWMKKCAYEEMKKRAYKEMKKCAYEKLKKCAYEETKKCAYTKMKKCAYEEICMWRNVHIKMKKCAYEEMCMWRKEMYICRIHLYLSHTAQESGCGSIIGCCCCSLSCWCCCCGMRILINASVVNTGKKRTQRTRCQKKTECGIKLAAAALPLAPTAAFAAAVPAWRCLCKGEWWV